MIIPCFRCGKGIDRPGAKNADYVIGKDTKKKTAIVCPQCHKPTDFVIWGVHKEKPEPEPEPIPA